MTRNALGTYWSGVAPKEFLPQEPDSRIELLIVWEQGTKKAMRFFSITTFSSPMVHYTTLIS